MIVVAAFTTAVAVAFAEHSRKLEVTAENIVSEIALVSWGESGALPSNHPVSCLQAPPGAS